MTGIEDGGLADRKRRLQEKLKRIEDEERRAQERREQAVGRAVLGAMERDPEFSDRIMRLLEESLTGKRDRALFGLSAAKGARGGDARSGEAG